MVVVVVVVLLLLPLFFPRAWAASRSRVECFSILDEIKAPSRLFVYLLSPASFVSARLVLAAFCFLLRSFSAWPTDHWIELLCRRVDGHVFFV